MIIKIRLKEESRKNLETLKNHYFSPKDRITAGYIIGLATENISDISDEEVKCYFQDLIDRNYVGESKPTSLSLRQGVYDRIEQMQKNIEKRLGKTIYLAHIIDLILANAVSKLDTSLKDDTLSFLEWNVNARTGYENYIVPVTLIANEIIQKQPHIFVLTEFVCAAGWVDLKHILEKEYDIYESPYIPHQNGICIGIKKNVGIVYFGETNQIINTRNKNFTPDFYEIKVKINNKVVSIIGTRIKIDCKKANSKIEKERHDEQKDRFKQFEQLLEYIISLDNVLLLGDFNNSRIIGDEEEIDTLKIYQYYENKDSIYYNFQKIRQHVYKKSSNKIHVHKPTGLMSSVGAFWNGKTAMPPIENLAQIHKYDHIITNFKVIDESVVYEWDFLANYTFENFEYRGNNSIIKAGFPDHAMLVGKVRVN